MIDTEGRQDTKLEAEGAEFLVLGFLLINGISSYKAYVNFRGYDLVAVDPDRRQTARIQVKSRWATDCDKSFSIRNFECDFVVHVMLNRGYRLRKVATTSDPGIRDPEFYVFPVDVVKQAQNAGNRWGTVRIVNIPEYKRYKSAWSQIAKFLGSQ